MAFKSNKKVNSEIPPVINQTGFSFKDAGKIGNDKYMTNQEAYDDKHGKLYEMTHNNTISWRRYVVYMILVTMLSCCFTYSKYVSNANLQGSKVSVAKFNYAITGTVEGVSINANNQMTSTPSVAFSSNDSKSYSFTVKNNSEVVVTVTPTASVSGGYAVSFVDGSSNTVNSTKPLKLTPNQEGKIKMTINPTNVENNNTSTMSLSFKVDQVD